MKKILLSALFVLLSTTMFAQSMNIWKNGTCQSFHVTKIDSITFNDQSPVYLSKVIMTTTYSKDTTIEDLYSFFYENELLSKYYTTFKTYYLYSDHRKVEEYIGTDIPVTKLQFKSSDYDGSNGFIIVYDSIKYNSKDYITSFCSSLTIENTTSKSNYTFIYNNDGELISVVRKVTQASGSKDKDYSITINWENGNLLSTNTRGVSPKETFVFTYSQTVNKNRQMPYSLVENSCFMDDEILKVISGLAMVGKFGNGPMNLPESYVLNCVYPNGQSRQKDHGTFSYSVNDDGNITQETISNPVDSKTTVLDYTYQK